MSGLELIVLSMALAMDAMAVSIAAGLRIGKVTGRHVFRAAFHFGLFQFGMTVLGYLAGMQLPEFLRAFDHWVALVLLCGIGGKMLWENFTDQPEKMAARDPTRGMTLIVLSIATSIDALAVGLGLALIDVSIWRASGSIGVITFLLSAIGIRFGGKLGVRWEHRAEILGAMVLIAIGLRIFISHGMDHGFGAH